MKNKFYIVFFTLILAGFTAFGQVTQIITHVDTLQSGDVIVTISDSQGNIIDKGLAKPGFSFQNDTVDLVFPTSTTTDNPEGTFIDNIDLPGNDGGFLPQDIVFNPHNNKYYIYGFRKVMICDENMQAIKTIDISDIDKFSDIYSDYHEKRIIVHPDENKVFCLTLNGVLISIDEYFNVVELTGSFGNYLIERSSMLFMPQDNSLWVYYYYYDENLIFNTTLKKYSIEGSQLGIHTLSEIIGYDMQSFSLENNYQILLTTNDGIKKYENQCQFIGTLNQGIVLDHMVVMNEMIFAHQTNSSILHFCNLTGTISDMLDLYLNNLRFMFACQEYDKLYYSGYSNIISGIGIVEKQGNNYIFSQIIESDNVFGIAENTTHVIACGSSEVIFINKSDNSSSTTLTEMIGQMYRIAPGSFSNEALVTQPLNGNCIKISVIEPQILETGGNISAICRKGDKLYVAVNKFNNKGYILVLNASSGAVLTRVTPSFDFNPVDVFCLDDENEQNHRVYVHYVIPENSELIGKILAFSCDDPSLINIADMDFANGNLEYLISPNGTIFIGERNDACPAGCYVYFYNRDLTEKREPIFAEGGCVKEFDYIPVREYLVFTSMCNSTVYFFKDSETGVTPLGSCYVPHPHTFSYSSNEEIGYCFQNDPNGTYLYKIEINFPTFNSSKIDIHLTFNSVHELFYNPNDDYTYGISEEMIYVISDEHVVNTYPFEIHPDIDNSLNRDDDYIFNLIDNALYLPVIDDTGLLNSKKVLTVELEDGTNQVYTSNLSYQKSISIFFPVEKFSLFGKFLTYYPEKQNLYCAQMYFSNSTLITTHNETKTLTGNWDWISFPCMPRLGNEGFASQAFLQNINPLQGYLRLTTKVGGVEKELTYENQIWNTDYIPFLYSTQGYKYDSEPDTIQSLNVTGVVLDPSTPIQLSSQYENWIGYFLEYPLRPEKAFALVWDKLTRITTKNWTLVKVNGQWISATRITPINYGDGLIVTCSEDCDLIWGYQYPASEEYEYPLTEYFGYDEKSEYTPFYFEMDSTSGIQEIGLTVNDSCVGAAVVEPGDSIVEVNAYLAGFLSGVPIEVETWSGYKSARIGTSKYSVVDPSTSKRLSRKVYTGEQKAFYIISFKAGETQGENPLVVLNPASPNPFSSATMLSFVLNQQANVALTVHDLRGNLIKTLMHGVYNEGFYEAGWTGTDTSGQQAGNGVYIIRLTVDDKIIKHEKVVLIK